MPAQAIKEVREDEVKRLLTMGTRLAANTYGIPSKNITITVRERTRPGYVKILVVQGCAC